MENASKALIIAASVLVTIMIIALGVTIFNKAQSSADTSNLDATEINMFNSKFERYIGDNQSGSQVKSLVSSLISNASTNKDDPSKLPNVILTVDGTPTSATGSSSASSNIDNYVTELGTIRGKIVSTHTYTVTCTYGGSGLITAITIQY